MLAPTSIQPASVPSANATKTESPTVAADGETEAVENTQANPISAELSEDNQAIEFDMVLKEVLVAIPVPESTENTDGTEESVPAEVTVDPTIVAPLILPEAAPVAANLGIQPANDSLPRPEQLQQAALMVTGQRTTPQETRLIHDVEVVPADVAVAPTTPGESQVQASNSNANIAVPVNTAPKTQTNPESQADTNAGFQRTPFDVQTADELPLSSPELSVSTPDSTESFVGVESTLGKETLQLGTPASDGDGATLQTNLERTTSLDAKIEPVIQNVTSPQNTATRGNDWGIAAAKQSDLQTSIANQVSDHIVSASHSTENGDSHLDIVLDPPELGRVKIELSNRNDQLDARLVVSDPNTLDAIKDSLQRLFDSLAEAGISLEGFQLEGSLAEKRRDPSDSDMEPGTPVDQPDARRAPQPNQSKQSLIDIFI